MKNENTQRKLVCKAQCGQRARAKSRAAVNARIGGAGLFTAAGAG